MGSTEEGAGLPPLDGARPQRGRLLRLAASCPRCGTPPAIRVTETMVRDAMSHPPDEPLSTYQCRRRQCGMIFEIAAAAYQRAS